jgi:hypothetical protein
MVLALAEYDVISDCVCARVHTPSRCGSLFIGVYSNLAPPARVGEVDELFGAA